MAYSPNASLHSPCIHDLFTKCVFTFATHDLLTECLSVYIHQLVLSAVVLASSQWTQILSSQWTEILSYVLFLGSGVRCWVSLGMVVEREGCLPKYPTDAFSLGVPCCGSLCGERGGWMWVAWEDECEVGWGGCVLGLGRWGGCVLGLGRWMCVCRGGVGEGEWVGWGGEGEWVCVCVCDKSWPFYSLRSWYFTDDVTLIRRLCFGHNWHVTVGVQFSWKYQEMAVVMKTKCFSCFEYWHMRVTCPYSKTIMRTGTTNTRSTASSTSPPPPAPHVFLPMLWIVTGVCMLLKHDCIVFMLPNNVKLQAVCFKFFFWLLVLMDWKWQILLCWHCM